MENDIVLKKCKIYAGHDCASIKASYYMNLTKIHGFLLPTDPMRNYDDRITYVL